MKLTAMALEEMKATAKQRKSDWALLRENQQAGIEPELDEDSPDATLLMRDMVNKKRAGRPPGSNKEQIALRVDRDVLDSYRAMGSGLPITHNSVKRIN